MSVADAKPFVMRLKSFATLSPSHCEDRGDEAIHICPASMDCFASLAMTISTCLCLLLLLLLARLQHPPLGPFNCLAQHLEIANVSGGGENQAGGKLGAALRLQPALAA